MIAERIDPPSPRTVQVLRAFVDLQHKLGAPPSLAELAAACRFGRPAALLQCRKLVDHGLLERAPVTGRRRARPRRVSRSLRVTQAGLLMAGVELCPACGATLPR